MNRQKRTSKLSPYDLIIVQPAVPSYRLDFFSRLVAAFQGNVVVYGTAEDMGVLTSHAQPHWQSDLPAIRRYIFGLEWQPGAVSIPLKRHDILVVCGAPRNISTIALMLRARLTGTKTIWWGHFWSATSRSWRFYLRMVLMRLADAVVFYTDDEVEEYFTKLVVRDDRIVSALNNGIDVVPVRKYRRSYTAVERENKLLVIGRLTAKAQLSILLTALRDPALKDVELEVIGEGPELDALMSKARALGVASQITWHGGTTDEKKIASIANKCKLFVYPGSVGLSLIHTMAYGLPSVVHDDRWTHMPEISAFSDGLTGFSFRAGSATNLAFAIARALSSPEFLESASAEAILRVESIYNTAAMAERMLEVIQRVAKQGTLKK